MMLFYLEAAGIPLVGALVRGMGVGPSVQLAAVFLLSNLLPAILLTPLLPACSRLLKKLWPNDPTPRPGVPEYLTTQALADPASALDLLPKELGRLLSSVSVEASGRDSTDPEIHTSPAFIQLGAAIEIFCVRLASESSLDAGQSLRLQRFRAWLHTIRHIGEAVGEFADAFATLSTDEAKIAAPLEHWLKNAIALAAHATSTLDQKEITKFHEESKNHNAATEEIRSRFSADIETREAPSKIALSALGDDFDIAAWLIHRVSKLELKATSAEA
jgi:phosphate:Na+ symporter